MQDVLIEMLYIRQNKSRSLLVHTLFLFGWFCLHVTACEFPDFVQTPLFASDGSASPWLTKKTSTTNGAKELRIRVGNGRINYTQSIDDIETNLYNRICVTENAGRFIFRHEEIGKNSLYGCMKFISRGKNLVQVEESALGDILDGTLCDRLEKTEWPWLAERKREWNFCPIIEGYDFTIKDVVQNVTICPHWRPFHMESECIKGEGLQITYPDFGDCSPFGTDRIEKFSCFAGWIEDNYIFMILQRDTHSFPDFALRLPRQRDAVHNFLAYLYFGAVTIFEQSGMPPAGHGIIYLELNMKLAGDVNREVADVQCSLPLGYQKQWTLYDYNFVEEVNIQESTIGLGRHAQFTCKDKHWSEEKYKFLSTFHNGCRARYTCIEFSQTNGNVLQYRISQSSKTDAGFSELCRFKDDDYPLRDSIRSHLYKNLVDKSNITPMPCGFNASIPFVLSVGHVTLNGEKSEGNVSDWNYGRCDFDSQLSISSDTSNEIDSTDHHCLAIIHEDAEYAKLLFTKNVKTHQFNCWVITNYDESKTWRAGRLMHKMPSTQCSAQSRFDVYIDRPSEATLYLYEDKQSRPCQGPTTVPTVTENKESGVSRAACNCIIHGISVLLTWMAVMVSVN